MAAPVTLRNFRDSFVNENKPSKNFSTLARLKVDNTAGARKFAFLFFGKPMPLGATITEGKLRLWNADAWAGSVTLTVERLTGKWSGSRVNWDNRPFAGGDPITLTKSNAPANTLWEFDIAPILQYVANGGAWYGLRITVNGSTLRNIHSAQSNQSDFRPQVLMQWSDAPEPPTDLAPNGGRYVSTPKPLLSYTFTDIAGDTNLDAHQVQIAATEAEFDTATDWDSGWVTTSVPEFDLAPSSYPGIPANTTPFWRVRVRDGAGVESSWSEPASMSYAAKVALTTSTFGTDGSGNKYVEDTSPPFIWALGAGRTQTAYQLIVSEAANPDNIIWESGKITSTAQTVTPPTPVIDDINTLYRMTLRVWDDLPREQNGTSPIYNELVVDFIYAPTSGVAAPTGLAATPSLPWPWIELTWSRSTPPDSFTVFRNGVVVEDGLLPADLTTGGTGYKYRDRRAAPRVEHTYTVRANVNGKDSSPSGQATAQTKPSVTWLMNPDSTSPICIVKSSAEKAPVVDAQAMTMQETHQPIGGGSPVLITQYLSGFEGHVSGVLADDIVQGLTARQMRDRFKAWKKSPGRVLNLFLVDEVLRIVPYNMTYRPRAKSGGMVLYDIEFDFFEQVD